MMIEVAVVVMYAEWWALSISFRQVMAQTVLPSLIMKALHMNFIYYLKKQKQKKTYFNLVQLIFCFSDLRKGIAQLAPFRLKPACNGPTYLAFGSAAEISFVLLNWWLLPIWFLLGRIDLEMLINENDMRNTKLLICGTRATSGNASNSCLCQGTISW